MNSVMIRDLTRPFYPILRHAMETGWADAMGAIRLIGTVRKLDRANFVHAAMRENLRDACDDCDPFLALLEEPEGQGLDVVRLTLNEQTVALRIGRYDQVAGRISRNKKSQRMVESQHQTFLFGDCFDPEGLPTATISYQVDDDAVMAGIPQWRMSKIALRRERVDSTEFIEDIATYAQANSFSAILDPRTPQYMTTKQNRRIQAQAIANQIISGIG